MKPNSQAAETSEVALAHDYLVQMGGAERVVVCFHSYWPDAPLYTSVLKREGVLPELLTADIRENWSRFMPGILNDFRRYFIIYPIAFFTQRPVRAKVLLISASTFAKFMRGSRDTTTICYCHAPTRFLWDNSSYLLSDIRSASLRALVRLTLPALRYMDRRAAQRIDVMVANSAFVRDKIRDAYGRDAIVIHPPVDLRQSEAVSTHLDYYLIVSRLVGYKGIDLAIEACRKMNRRLVIVGEGPDKARLEQIAKGAMVSFRGRLSEDAMQCCLRECRAFIFPGQEDFGIAPVEAQGWGKPVIALARGGALETVVEGKTGVFFPESTPESIIDALCRFEALHWDASTIRGHAMRFSQDRFEREIRSLLAPYLQCI